MCYPHISPCSQHGQVRISLLVWPEHRRRRLPADVHPYFVLAVSERVRPFQDHHSIAILSSSPRCAISITAFRIHFTHNSSITHPHQLYAPVVFHQSQHAQARPAQLAARSLALRDMSCFITILRTH